jgi:apolipoprotein N-acyltransferase
MRWITRPGWPGNLLAVVAGASTTLALAPFDIWPLALLSIALFYAGLRELSPRQALAVAGASVSACMAPAPGGSTSA